jgi:hypothetical protein
VTTFFAPVFSSAGDADWQLWNFESVDVKLSPLVNIRLDEGFKINDDISRFYYQYSDPAIIYRKFTWLTSAIAYRLAFVRTGDVWLWECRPYVYLTPQFTWRDWTLSGRSRLGWNHRQNTKDIWRCRYQLMLTRRIQLFSISLKNSMFYEIFWNISNEEISQHRYNIGLNAGLLSNLNLRLFFMRIVTKKGGSWADNDIIGIGLRAIL